MNLFEVEVKKGLKVESLGGYSMVHNVRIPAGRIGTVTKSTNLGFTVLFNGDTKGIGFPLCGKGIFKIKD